MQSVAVLSSALGEDDAVARLGLDVTTDGERAIGDLRCRNRAAREAGVRRAGLSCGHLDGAALGPLFPGRGQPPRQFLSLLDVTALKDAEAVLREIQR